MTRIKWDTTKKELSYILAIAERAVQLDLAPGWTKQDYVMDITACHANGCPLDLQKLLHAEGVHFAHDVLGIRRFLDRSTGKIDAARFDPRCSLAIQSLVLSEKQDSGAQGK